MNKETYERIINYTMSKGVEFVELYYEEMKDKLYLLVDSKLDSINGGNSKGLGIRVYHNNTVYYTSINDSEYKDIIKQIDILLNNISNLEEKQFSIKLEKEEILIPKIKIKHNEYPKEKKIELLKNIDKEARSYSNLISQVRVLLYEGDKKYTITNSRGIYKTTTDSVISLVCNPYAKEDDNMENDFNRTATSLGYEFFKDFDYKEFARSTAEVAVNKLSAKKFKGGSVPVIIEKGNGAVLFHEACGHSLEATAVADGVGVMSNKLGKKIASSKVTLIDNGTFKGYWGTSIIDSEGNKTRENVLIENGVLKSYLVDDFNSKKMNHEITGSGRRQNFRYAPTSRMNNTYLAPGKDKIEDMFKSIDYGVYCKKVAGGSVNTATGDFNFGVPEAYLIENGKITTMLKGLTLIGKGEDILKRVEMVADDLEFAASDCGSVSGRVHVTCGEPTVKVSEMLVGGSE